MKVRDLQEQLGELDPDLDVVCYSEDATLLAEGHGFVLFDILAVRTSEAERLRLRDQTPYLKFKSTEASGTIAIVEVTADF